MVKVIIKIGVEQSKFNFDYHKCDLCDYIDLYKSNFKTGLYRLNWYLIS